MSTSETSARGTDTASTLAPSQAGPWIIFAGAALGVIGAIVMAVASKKRKYEEGVDLITDSLRGMRSAYQSPSVQSAITLGHVGLGVLVFGLALLLCGIVITAVRRPT